jgi:hypothetical protein
MFSVYIEKPLVIVAPAPEIDSNSYLESLIDASSPDYKFLSLDFSASTKLL